MSGPPHGTPGGDSTPDFDFLREHDDGSRTRWPIDPEHDSATDMLPPEEESLDAAPVTAPLEPDEGLDAGESGSSIHHVPAAPNEEQAEEAAQPGSTVLTEPEEPIPADEPGEASDDAAFAGVMETVSQVADAIEGEPAAAPVSAEATPETGESPRKHNLFVVALASYASAVTIALLYLLFQRATADPSVLESLPDVAPLREGEVMRRVPVDAGMPPGHTLALGESRRFGNIVVTPLRVVREPVDFVHYSGRGELTRPETEPVLKLWVRFTNASADQSIAPLDGRLLFTRVFRQGEMWANQFVCTLKDKRAGREPVLVYDHSPTDEFDLVDQHLGRVLEPGESYETYIPTTEADLDRLTGELVWRVHFRKGYSPSGYGVTTVVEVRFDDSRIQPRAETSVSARTAREASVSRGDFRSRIGSFASSASSNGSLGTRREFVNPPPRRGKTA